ncbi:MAG: galactose mutarotase [Actinobacteria bacterium]|nr:galactose mutarotase [Actinomycetota bacterium]
MGIKKDFFGKSGKEKGVFLYTLENDNGIIIKITNFGAAVTTIITKDRIGKAGHVVLGFDNLEQYEAGHPFFGVICGRYANRIAKGKFKLDGKEYILAINNAPNSLHGGNKGFDKVIWNSEPIEKSNEVGVKLSYFSPDMEEGYPGNMNVEVTYLLNNSNELTILYSATTEKKTVVNLTNHCYFNLAGCNKEIYNQVLYINADKITEVDNTSIPTGNIPDVAGTGFDFRKPTKIGDQLKLVPGGIDHNYVLNKPKQGELTLASKLYDPESGRTMETYTTEPGIQFYSGNYLDGSNMGHDGTVYKKHFALCLETQHYPDSPNHPDFPNTVLNPRETYTQKTIYKFGVE